MLDAVHAVEEPLDFLKAEDDGQLLLLLGKRENVFEGPVLSERHPIEEAKRRDDRVSLRMGGLGDQCPPQRTTAKRFSPNAVMWCTT